MQVHVADDGTGRHARPLRVARSAHQVVHVEGVGRHRELALLVPPRVPRSVGVHLDAEPIRIGEVDRFAHQVIGHAGLHPDSGQMLHKPAECGSIGEEDGEVIEAQAATSGHGCRAAPLAKRNQRCRVGHRAERSRPRIATLDMKAEYVLVVPERTLQVSDLKRDSSQSGRRRESIAGRRDAVFTHAIASALRWRFRARRPSTEYSPGPTSASVSAEASRESGNSTPFGAKKPAGRCTSIIAPIIVKARPSATTRVNTPKMSASPPKNSSSATAGPAISGSGTPICVNPPVTPASPYTNSFWAPCATKMAPITVRSSARPAWSRAGDSCAGIG